MVWVLMLLVFAGLAGAQEPAPAVKLEAQKLTIQRAREATARCEEDLGLLWAQATALKKEHDTKLQELETLKQEVDTMKKQLDGHHAGRAQQ